MQIYLVGGAVRDHLLNYPFKEKDWVVVGATVEEMLDLGYQQVGKDFPVFLHPETRDEHALARTERKTAPGYKGFAVHASPDVTLEQDLERRDLTINAMAQDAQGNIVDPFRGQQDLQAKTLRHISSAFCEDPVRILRVARFAARYAHLGFTVAAETLQLMSTMVAAGEADALVAERVWQEMHKALGEKNPEVFFETLRSCGALQRILPEVDNLFGVPQPEIHHPEIDTGIHTMLVLQQACKLSDKTTVRFAALCHDFGKATTPKDKLPSHHGHEDRGKKLVKKLCARLRIPNEHRDLAIITAQFHTHVHRALELKKTTLLKTLEQVDAVRKPQRFAEFILACTADIRGRPGYEDEVYPQADYMRTAAEAIRNINIEELKNQNLDGKDMAEAIRTLRLQAIKEI
ncbi:MAG: multifunctional CCA addition/repair protein [Gammaproteobacteria bacterium]|nr:multifunctional CCA addition/repair protein [Gammaproteobacteria bacterium]